MPFRNIHIFIFLIQSLYISAQEASTYVIHTIAFYNLENLFDTKNDPLTYDDDRTPKGKYSWTESKYFEKIKNMAKVISEIGVEKAKQAPTLIGVAEIENRNVLEDLINTDVLKRIDYGIVHFDSPDKRGIDVALLYQKKGFRPVYTSTQTVFLYDQEKPNQRVYTRDQLLVSGYLDGEFIHIIVNHWPSRSGGVIRSNYKRIQAAKRTKKTIDSLFTINPYAKIMIMGDFNDDPTNTSIQKILNAKASSSEVPMKGLYNPMTLLDKKGMGSLAWNDRWNIFDQIIITPSFLSKTYTTYQYYQVGIFNPPYLISEKGRYRGYPFRSFVNGNYTGGYSDHFPVYMYLIKELPLK